MRPLKSKSKPKVLKRRGSVPPAAAESSTNHRQNLSCSRASCIRWPITFRGGTFYSLELYILFDLITFMAALLQRYISNWLFMHSANISQWASCKNHPYPQICSIVAHTVSLREQTVLYWLLELLLGHRGNSQVVQICQGSLSFSTGRKPFILLSES